MKVVAPRRGSREPNRAQSKKRRYLNLEGANTQRRRKFLSFFYLAFRSTTSIIGAEESIDAIRQG
jgi:hypothetical protein